MVATFENLNGRFLPGITAAADYSALSPRGHYAVTITGDSATVAGAAANAAGFMTNNPKQSAVADIALEGNIVRGVSSAAFAQGAKLGCAASGKLRTAVSGDHVVGRALAAATGGDQIVPVLVTLGGAPLP